MFCYHGTCTNQSGDALPGYYVEAVVGLTVQPIYSDNSSTPIIGASGVANRAKTDSRGNFFFYIADGTYDLNYYNEAGVLQFSETGFSMASAEGVSTAAASAAAAAASAAAAAAYTSAKTATTAALIAAIRTNGMFPQPLTRISAGNTPTVTIGAANAASALNARSYANPLMLLSDTKFKWLSGPTSQDPNLFWVTRGAYYTPGNRTNQYTSFEFNHTGTAFELSTYANFNGANNNIRIWVNDVLAAVVSVTAQDGSFRYVNFTFPGSATRRIRVEGDAGRWRGVNVVSSTEVAATGRTYPLITVMGDSFVEGTGATAGWGGEAVQFAKALGCNGAIQGVGATGLLNPGTGGKVAWTDATRMTDLTMSGVTDALGGSTAPALGVVMMSMNDANASSSLWNGAATFQAAIQKGCFTLIDAWQTANPGKPLLFIGPTWPNSSVQFDIYRMRDATQEAAWAYNNANVWFLDRLNPLPVLRGTADSYTATTGNTNSNTTLNGLASTANVGQGSGVIGTGIPDGTRVVSVDSSVSVTLSNAATATATGVAITFKNDQAAIYTNVQAGDATHPDQAGHNYDALWMAKEARRLILSEFA